MPIVPRVAPTPLPGVRLNPANVNDDAFGGGKGNAYSGLDLSPVHAEAQRIAVEEKQKADQVAVVDAGAKLSSLETSTLYGEDGQGGALSAKGQDAFAMPEQARAQWQKGVADISANLGNDDQRVAFHRMATERGSSVDEQIQRHVAGQRQQYDTDTTNAFLTNETNAALSSYTDPKRVQLAIDNQTAALQGFGKRNGIPPEKITEQIAAAVSGTQTGVVDRMLSAGNYLGAKDYYAQHQDQIVGTDQARLDKALKEGSVRGASQQAADKILQSAANLTDAVKSAREIQDPDVRDMTEQRVRSDFAERQQALRETREQSYQSATNILEQTKDVAKIPPTMWSQFTVGERDALRNYQEKLIKGIPVETDPVQYYALRTAAVSGDAKVKNGFINTNLLTFSDALSKTDMHEMIDLQMKMRQGDEKAAMAIAGLRSRNQIATETFNAAISPAGKAPDKQRARNAQLAQFNQALDARIAQYTSDNNGKKASPDEVQRMADDLMIKAATTQGTQHFVFESQPGEKLVFSIKDVPFRERKRITSYLSGRGLPTNDAAVLKVFTQSLNNTVPPGTQNGQP